MYRMAHLIEQRASNQALILANCIILSYNIIFLDHINSQSFSVFKVQLTKNSLNIIDSKHSLE